MERIVLFLHRIAYYVIGVQANYALAHSTLTIVLTEKKEKKKKKYLGHFDYSTPFLGSVESVLNVLNGGEIIFFARKKKTRAILTITSLILFLLRINLLIRV